MADAQPIIGGADRWWFWLGRSPGLRVGSCPTAPCRDAFAPFDVYCPVDDELLLVHDVKHRWMLGGCAFVFGLIVFAWTAQADAVVPMFMGLFALGSLWLGLPLRGYRRSLTAALLTWVLSAAFVFAMSQLALDDGGRHWAIAGSVTAILAVWLAFSLASVGAPGLASKVGPDLDDGSKWLA